MWAIDDEGSVRIQTTKQLGAAVRDRRRQREIDQAGLAAIIGTSRQWIIGLEAGKATVPFNLVLRALKALDLQVALVDAGSVPKSAASSPGAIDLDAIVDRAKGA